MNERTRIAAALLTAALSVPAGAETVPVAPIVVTATRTAQTADQALASVTVITREEIERKQARTVEDLLRGVRGVALTNNGGLGKVTSVLMRGTESDHVLVLVDGIKVGSATVGTAAFEQIPVEQIERIEVVRGPRSSLYGSEAIGGVIQIFTRKGGGPLTPSFSLGAGSYQTYRGSAAVSGGGERGWYNASLSGVDSEGFNACTGEPLVAGCFTVEPDDDGHRSLSGSLRGGYRFEGGGEVDVSFLRAEGDTEFDGDFQNETETVQQVLGGSARFMPTDLWEVTLRLGRSWDESENTKDGVFASRFDTVRDVATLQNDLFMGADHLLTLGLDYQEDRVDASTAFVEDSRDNRAVFGQYQGALGRHDLQASLRRDDNEQFGGHTTGALAWGLDLGRGLRLTASYGTAFKAPTFNDLYFPGFGNPDLDPEASRSLELGLAGRTGWGGWSVDAYQTDIDDLITFDANTFRPENVDEARIRGLEAALSARVMGWQVAADLTLLDTENRGDGPDRGNALPRRAERALGLDLDRDLGRFALGGSLTAEGKRYDDLPNARKLDGYVRVDLRGEYRPAPGWRLQARLDNLLDEDYETASYYNQPGRSVFLTLRWAPPR